MIPLEKLRHKIPVDRLVQPERIGFTMLIYVDSGTGTHSVDFEYCDLQAGSLVLVHPGQVQQWQAKDSFSATLLLIEPAALPYSGETTPTGNNPLPHLHEWQTHSCLTQDQSIEVQRALDQIKEDTEHYDNSEISLLLIRHEAMALLLRIERWQRSPMKQDDEVNHHLSTYRLFMSELEATFQQHRSLSFYAKRLGYSPGTISRSTIAMAGLSAKQVIDQRVALEGKRLLVHSTLPIDEITHQLGFSEATNFSKFFKRVTGDTPVYFRKKRMGIF